MPEDLTIVSNPKDRQELKAMLVEMTNSMLRIDAEREQMKDIATAAQDKFGIKTKLFRKIATTMFKHNYSDVQAENEHFELLYEQLVEGKSAGTDSEAA